MESETSKNIKKENETCKQVEARRERRSSIFFLPEQEVTVDVKFTNEVNYPPDYYNKLQDEYKKWQETISGLRNEISVLTKELDEKPRLPIDMTILDKDEQDFFKNIPGMYFKYINLLEEFSEEVHTAFTVSENIAKWKNEVTNNLVSQLEDTDKKLKEYLQTNR